MYGELTEKETVSRIEYALENQQLDQFEILLYKKNSKNLFFLTVMICITLSLLNNLQKHHYGFYYK